MPNSPTHQLAAAIGTGGVLVCDELKNGEMTLKPMVGAAVAAATTNLPDYLEPATNPHHRQFFHSIAFAGFVGWSVYKVYQWQPKDDLEKFVRFLTLVTASAVLIHLALDASTPRSLPLIGKL